MLLGEPGLVGLLHRADWTQLSLSAQPHWVTDHADYYEKLAELRRPSWARPPHEAMAAHAKAQARIREPQAGPVTGRLLIAPGRRFRMQTAHEDGDGTLRGCDGDRAWWVFEQDEEAERVQMFCGPEPPLPDLLCPSWLLSYFELELDGPGAAAGRDAYRVVARPRPVAARDPAAGAHALLDRVDAVVDAELGILLRCEKVFEGRTISRYELRAVTVDPPEAADPAQFAPPPGATVSEGVGASFDSPGWRAAKTAAGFAATGLGFAIRHSPRHPPRAPADGEEAMPPAGPRPADADLPRAGDDVLYLLYRGGLPAQGFAAELHQWHDPSAIMRWVRSGTRSAGITGLGSLADAVGERAPTIHRVARIRIGALDQYPLAALDRYRIDYLRGADKRKPKTVVCDGQRRWRFYGDRVSVGPAVPVPEEIATLAAPSWLLAWRLSSAAEVLIGGRECFLFSAQNLPLTAGARPTAAIFSPVEVVLDARLGIPLRLTSYVADQPAVRFELRDVTTGGATGLGDFRFDVPPGVRVVEASGGILDEADAPQPVKFAAKAAGDIARHAGPKIAAVASFLDGLRGKSAPASGPDGE